jgi:hypothetical protein
MFSIGIGSSFNVAGVRQLGPAAIIAPLRCMREAGWCGVAILAYGKSLWNARSDKAA